MERKEILKNVVIIFCVFVLFAIPWASVFGIKDPGLLDTIAIVQRTGAFLVLTGMVVKLIYQIYYSKPLTQEMKEEEIKEADQEDGKQLLFKPPIIVFVVFMFLILPFGLGIFWDFITHNVNFLTIMIIGVMVFFIWAWYKTPVFIFTDDSVQIKSHPLYLLGIDWKTVIRYADITSVGPDTKMDGNLYGINRKNWIKISRQGTTQTYPLDRFNPDIVAKIYLRFKEKLGDKVTLR
jgi:hypothetical protein